MHQTSKAEPLKEKLTTLLSSWLIYSNFKTESLVEKLAEGRKLFYPIKSEMIHLYSQVGMTFCVC